MTGSIELDSGEVGGAWKKLWALAGTAQAKISEPESNRQVEKRVIAGFRYLRG